MRSRSSTRFSANNFHPFIELELTMAILAKKIHIKNSAGVEQTVTLYSTTAEIATASGYTFQLVDGVTAYAALVPTSHARATSGRVIKSGTTYAWGSTAPAPAYAYKLFTTAGSGTFTVPTGVTKLRVTCVGGGAGATIIGINGEAACAPANTHPNVSGSGTNALYTSNTTLGTNTTFGSVTAARANPAKFNGKIACMEECVSNGREGSCSCVGSVFHPTAIASVSTGFNNGTSYLDGNYVIEGGAAVPLVGIDGVTRASVGAGGYGDGHQNNPCGSRCVASGGSGYRTISTISVTPGQTIAYTVGNGGNFSRREKIYTSCYSHDGTGGCPGSAGGILVEYGSGIE